MKKTLIYSATAAGLSLTLGLAARYAPGFAEWYAANIYPLFLTTVGRLTGLFPFSVAEILLMLLILAVIVALVILIVKLVRGKGRRKLLFARAGTVAACGLSTLALMYIVGCGINYSRVPFRGDSGLSPVSEPTDIEGWIVYLNVLEELEQVLPHIQTDENGVFILTGDLSKTAPAAMRNLAQQYPRLDVYYPQPKPILNSWLFSQTFFLGVFSPFTFEANYNNQPPDAEIAQTALHELAHAAGFMVEEEADFIAFLAARNSGDPELIYSALLDVLSRLSTGGMTAELYERLPPEYREKYDRVNVRNYGENWRETIPKYTFGDSAEVWFAEVSPAQVERDIDAIRRFWISQRNEIIVDDNGDILEVISVVNPVFQEATNIASGFNNAHLKFQGQEDGIGGYMNVIDWMVAFYLQSA